MEKTFDISYRYVKHSWTTIVFQLKYDHYLKRS